MVAALELDGAFEEHARGDAEEEVDEVVMVCWEAEGVAHESDSDSDDEAASDEEKDLAEEIFSEETVLLLMQ